MKMFHLNCPRCGKFFYGELLLVDNRLPLHCPGCDAYLPPEEYGPLLGAGRETALARINKPLNETTIPEIIYRPDQKER